MEFKVDGATLRVEVEGPGGAPTIILWNGAACTLRMWDQVVPQLTKRYRVIRFDVRGVGGSTPTQDRERQYTFEQYAADVNEILAIYNAAKCHIWSMAWGTRAAIAYAGLHPGRVLSAALFDANIGPSDTHAQQQGSKQALARQEAAGIPRFALPDGWNRHDHPGEVQRAMAASAKFDLGAVVDRLTMPVLVATGDHDPNLASSREIAARLPNARLEVMADVGHGSVLQRPDLTARIYLEFLATLPR